MGKFAENLNLGKYVPSPPPPKQLQIGNFLHFLWDHSSRNHNLDTEDITVRWFFNMLE